MPWTKSSPPAPPDAVDERRTRIVRKQMADGTTKTYHYPAERKPKPAPESRYARGTVGGLLVAYRQSPEWHALRPSSQKTYNHMLAVLEAAEAIQLTALSRGMVVEWRDRVFARSGAAQANSFISTVRVAFQWAIERDLMALNPAARIKPLDTGTITPWTADQADQAQAHLKPEWLRRAVVLARYTAQRRGDLCAMMWGQYDGALIKVTQQKTGVALSVPVAPELRAELEAWRRERPSLPAARILTLPSGRPVNPASLSTHLGAALARIGLPGSLAIHGLRKLRMTELADAGCSAHEIAAISGHTTLKMVSHYTRSADQLRLAQQAQARVSLARKG